MANRRMVGHVRGHVRTLVPGQPQGQTRNDWLHERYRNFGWMIQTTFLAWISLDDYVKGSFRAVVALLIFVWGVMTLVAYYLEASWSSTAQRYRHLATPLVSRGDKVLLFNLAVVGLGIIVYLVGLILGEGYLRGTCVAGLFRLFIVL